jgi:hypothetical protein
MFRKVNILELKDSRWLSKMKSLYSPHIVQLTSRFNQLSYWVSTQIVTAFEHNFTATKVITFFIKVMKVNFFFFFSYFLLLKFNFYFLSH